MQKEKDPICGMTVNIKEAEKKNLTSLKDGKMNYFCSTSCKQKFDSPNSNIPFHKSEKFGKIFPYFLATILILGTALSIYFKFMILYMGIFFIIFSLFKMPDWKGFTQAFPQYDILAKRIPFYAAIYPLIELTLGIFFILNYYGIFSQINIIAWTTLFIMSFGAIGVGIKISKKEKFQCACLGTWINVPLTKVTLLEDVLMAGMAIILLI